LGYRQKKLLGNALILLGVILLITGTLLPYYKIPQKLSAHGPKDQYGPYTISTYITPPIDKGTPINLNFLSDRPGTTTILLAPFDPVEQNIGFPIVLHVAFGTTQKGIVYFSLAPKSAPYLLMITSYNGTSFQFTLDSVWSPFYQYRGATTFGIFVLLVGVASVYYFEYAEQKERMFKKALSGLQPR
jgi:hypothetical protein